jgi:aminopeptidase N
MHVFKAYIAGILWCVMGLVLMTAPAWSWSQPHESPPRYDIRVNVQAEALVVEAIVSLPPVAEARASLHFKLLPSMGEPQVRLVSPTATGNLKVRRVKDEGDDYRPRTIWEIEPATPFPAGQPIVLNMSFNGGGKGALVHYVGPEIVIASGIVQPWFPQFSDEKILGSLHLDIPAGLLAVASGKRVAETVSGDRRLIEFQMASPTRLNFAAGPVQVIKAPQKVGEVPINLYLLREREFAGDLVNLVRDSIAALEREFGSFPYDEFAVVEVPTEPGAKAFFSGASQDAYILMRTDDIDWRRADPRSSFFAHEVGHQWWGVSVSYPGGDGGDFMLDEALAEYGAIRVNAALLGSAGEKAFRDDARDKVLLRIAAGYDGPLNHIPEAPLAGSDFFHQDVARAKGALVYDVIRQGIGAARMRDFFNEITSVFSYSTRITWGDFLSRLRKAAGPGNQWMIDQWFHQTGLPVLDMEWSARNGGVALVIGQQLPGMPLYRLQLPVRLEYTDGSAELRQVEVAAEAQSRAVLKVGKTVTRVELDPERTMPWVSPGEFANAVAVKTFTLAMQLDNMEGKTAEAEELLKAALDARTAPDATPAEFLERYYYGWILEEAGRRSEAFDHCMRALQAPVRDEQRLPQLYVNIARVSAALGDHERARWAAHAAVALVENGKDEARARRIMEQAAAYLH